MKKQNKPLNRLTIVIILITFLTVGVCPVESRSMVRHQNLATPFSTDGFEEAATIVSLPRKASLIPPFDSERFRPFTIEIPNEKGEIDFKFEVDRMGRDAYTAAIFIKEGKNFVKIEKGYFHFFLEDSNLQLSDFYPFAKDEKLQHKYRDLKIPQRILAWHNYIAHIRNLTIETDGTHVPSLVAMHKRYFAEKISVWLPTDDPKLGDKQKWLRLDEVNSKYGFYSKTIVGAVFITTTDSTLSKVELAFDPLKKDYTVTWTDSPKLKGKKLKIDEEGWVRFAASSELIGRVTHFRKRIQLKGHPKPNEIASLLHLTDWTARWKPTDGLVDIFGEGTIKTVFDAGTGDGNWMDDIEGQPWLADDAEIIGSELQEPYDYSLKIFGWNLTKDEKAPPKVLPEGWVGRKVVQQKEDYPEKGSIDLFHSSFMQAPFLNKRGLLLTSFVPKRKTFELLDEYDSLVKDGGWFVMAHRRTYLGFLGYHFLFKYYKLWFEKKQYKYVIYQQNNIPNDYPKSTWFKWNPYGNSKGYYLIVAKKEVPFYQLSEEDKLARFGVRNLKQLPLRYRIDNDQKQLFLDTVDLEPDNAEDPKNDWVMTEPRDVDQTGEIKSFGALEATPLTLTQTPLVRLGSFRENESPPEMDDDTEIPYLGAPGNRTYLGFVDSISHPVVIKFLSSDIAFKGSNKLEIYLAQLYSIWGKGPKFYGIGKAENGQYFLVMQAISGHYSSLEQGDQERIFGAFSENIDHLQFLKNRKGTMLPFDFSQSNLRFLFIGKAQENSLRLGATREFLEMIKREARKSKHQNLSFYLAA